MEVKDSAEIEEVFDDIAYMKGSSIIRMLANYIGLETFQKGNEIFLNIFLSNAQGLIFILRDINIQTP